MFIVVAIVIFGIFIGMSYLVFGSEGVLSKGLENIFIDAIEQTNDSLIGLIKGDNEDIYSQHESQKDIVFDFNRKLTADGPNVVGYKGEFGIVNAEGVYVLSATKSQFGGPVVRGSLERVYIYSDLEDTIGFNVKETRLKVNNQELPVTLKIEEADDFDGKDIKRYFAVIPSKLDLELNKVYTFKVSYLLENNTYYEFEKSLMITE